jgi:hypothetical protein
MALKVGALTEAFPTLLAFVRLLPSVSSVVYAETRAAAESLATTVASVGLLPGVGGLRTMHRAVAEAATRFMTSVQVLFRVKSLMSLQV